jgi:hypothetical protein
MTPFWCMNRTNTICWPQEGSGPGILQQRGCHSSDKISDTHAGHPGTCPAQGRFLNRSIAPARLNLSATNSSPESWTYRGCGHTQQRLVPGHGNHHLEAGETRQRFNDLQFPGQSGASMAGLCATMGEAASAHGAVSIDIQRQAICASRSPGPVRDQSGPCRHQVWDITHPFAIRCPDRQQGSVLHFRAARIP